MAEAGKPAPDAGEVLVKVLAISVNAAGNGIPCAASPLFSRATLGLPRPEQQIPGVDVARAGEGGGQRRYPVQARR